MLISPFIKPGSVSNVFYNHYSWLRTMEDMFSVGRTSPGLDGRGHLGYAAQAGLADFGPDVFTNVRGFGGGGPGGLWAAPLAGLAVFGAVPALGRHRRRRGGGA